MFGKLVLVTGVGGFIAAHIADQLLERGYRVRGTARGPKYQILIGTVKRPGLEFVRIDDMATSDFTAALAGVDAVIHLACPLPGRKSIEETFSSAVEGTMNVVRQAQRAGVKKLVVTSSFGCLLSPTHMPAFHGLTFTEKDWGVTDDAEFEQQKDNKFYVYFTAKIKAETTLWDFAHAHPELEVATILPGYVIGPYSAAFPLPADVASMGTNDLVLQIITGGAVPPAPNWLVDVRDVARAHVLALERLPLGGQDDARFIVNAATLPWAKAAAHIAHARPALAACIEPLDTIAPLPGVLSDLDNARTKAVLGIGAYIALEESLVAAVDAVLALQKRWGVVN